MQQEQTQQMQSLLGQLGETLKVVSQRLDEQAKANVKAFADQKLVIDALQRDLRVLREKVDDSNTRLGSVSQEVEALRQGLQQALQASARAADLPIRPTRRRRRAATNGDGSDRRAAGRRRAGRRRHVAQPSVRHGVFRTTRPVCGTSRSMDSTRSSARSRSRTWPTTRRSTSATRSAGRQERQGGRSLRPRHPHLSQRRQDSRRVLQEGARAAEPQANRPRAPGLGIRRQDVSSRARPPCWPSSSFSS